MTLLLPCQGLSASRPFSLPGGFFLCTSNDATVGQDSFSPLGTAPAAAEPRSEQLHLNMSELLAGPFGAAVSQRPQPPAQPTRLRGRWGQGPCYGAAVRKASVGAEGRCRFGMPRAGRGLLNTSLVGPRRGRGRREEQKTMASAGMQPLARQHTGACALGRHRPQRRGRSGGCRLRGRVRECPGAAEPAACWGSARQPEGRNLPLQGCFPPRADRGTPLGVREHWRGFWL